MTGRTYGPYRLYSGRTTRCTPRSSGLCTWRASRRPYGCTARTVQPVRRLDGEVSNPSNTLYSRATSRLDSVVRLNGTAFTPPSTGRDPAAGDDAARGLAPAPAAAEAPRDGRGGLLPIEHFAALAGVARGTGAPALEDLRDAPTDPDANPSMNHNPHHQKSSPKNKARTKIRTDPASEAQKHDLKDQNEDPKNKNKAQDPTPEPRSHQGITIRWTGEPGGPGVQGVRAGRGC